MFEIVYRSKATSVFSEQDLKSLLLQARSANEANDITGLLVFDGVFFVQIIEGGKRNCELLYEKIRNDDRHQDVETLWSQGANSLNTRTFSEWSMGYTHTAPGALRTDTEFWHEYMNANRDDLSHGARLFRLLAELPGFGSRNGFVNKQFGRIDPSFFSI